MENACNTQKAIGLREAPVRANGKGARETQPKVACRLRRPDQHPRSEPRGIELVACRTDLALVTLEHPALFELHFAKLRGGVLDMAPEPIVNLPTARGAQKCQVASKQHAELMDVNMVGHAHPAAKWAQAT